MSDPDSDPESALQSTPPGAPGHDPLSTPIAVLLRRAPVTCPRDTPVRDALARMRQENVGSILLMDESGAPAGMFTLKDLRDRVALGACDIDQPMSRVMTPHPFCLPAEAPAFQAALAMAQRSIHHVVVTRDGGVVGVISEKDLFDLQRVGVTRIASTLCLAEDLPTLQRAAEDTRRLARNLMAQGVGAEQLTLLISQLNDQLTQRILYLAFAGSGLEDASWCWLSLGSEGRLEQTLLTDQDNGLIFVPPEGRTAEDLRPAFLAVAQRVNEWLDACGFPLCKGEVMASNPKWCLTLAEWQDTFGQWIFRGDAPVLLNASIFFDFRPLAGDTRLAESLRQWLHERIKDNRQFLKLLVLNALGNRPPLGLVRDFTLDGEGAEAGTLELKMHGTTPFVDAARIFALAAGQAATGTVARLREAGAAWKLDTDEVEAWVGAFLYIQQTRLQLHQRQLDASRPLGNRLDPEVLSSVERQALKEAFRQARKLQGRMESFFQF